jgi:hypothetical protein
MHFEPLFELFSSQKTVCVPRNRAPPHLCPKNNPLEILTPPKFAFTQQSRTAPWFRGVPVLGHLCSRLLQGCYKLNFTHTNAKELILGAACLYVAIYAGFSDKVLVFRTLTQKDSWVALPPPWGYKNHRRGLSSSISSTRAF